MNRWKPAHACLVLLSLAVACTMDDPFDPADLEVPDPVATLLAKVAGDDQTGGAGEPLPSPLTVRVLDQFGEPVDGASVLWSVIAGDGSLEDEVTLSDAAGLASVEWTLGGTPGLNEAAATTDPTTTSVTFSATAVAGSPAAIQLAPDTLRFDALGDTARVAMSAQDAFGNPIASPMVTWISANPARASVNGGGLVTAQGTGQTTVVAASGDAADTVVVVVSQAPAQLELTPESVTLIGVADTTRLSARVFDRNGRQITGVDVVWSVADDGVATVNDAGLLTAVSDGSTTVVAAHDTVADTTTVTVRVPAAIALSPTADTLAAIGDTLRLTATVTDADGATIEGATVLWMSLDTAIARVDAYGRVTARDTGDASIVATTGAVTDTATISVAPPAPPPAPERVTGSADEEARFARVARRTASRRATGPTPAVTPR